MDSGTPIPVPITAGPTLDPFGLWQAAPIPDPGGLAYGSGLEAQAPALRWEVDLATETGGLEQRALKIERLDAGAEDAQRRLAALLRAGPAAPVSYSPEATAESNLLFGLASLNTPADYGLGLGIDWNALAASFSAFRDLVNHQLLHFLWVDTRIAGALAARTTINWGSDTSAYFLPALPPDQIGAHQRSLALALRSRLVNLGIFVRVTHMAAQILLAISTPAGPLQVLGLAWQFTQEILLPQLRQLEQSELQPDP